MRQSRRSDVCPETGFSLLELLVAITIMALLSTAVIASFRIGLSSWRRGEDFMERSQKLSAAVELLHKQLGSANPLFPLSSLTEPAGRDRAVPVEAQNAPAFVGSAREVVFVSGYPVSSTGQGGMQVIHYAMAVPVSTTPLAAAGMTFQVTAVPIFHRDDFLKMAAMIPQGETGALTLLENVQDITFQYWGEEQPSPSPEAEAKVKPRLVAFDQWDGTKTRRLPEAVSIQIRFARTTESGAAIHPYNREAVDLFVPINVAKSD